MKLKRTTTVLLVIMLLVSQFSFLNFSNLVYAEDEQIEEQNTLFAKHYFYDQLTEDSKKFYKAMEEMYTSGELKTGTYCYDLVENNVVTQEQLASYASGNQSLLNTMGAAKDAFMMDYPNIFYVDFDYLTLRVTLGADGYHATLGTGRSDTYRNKAFIGKSVEEIDTAIEQVEKEVNRIVEGAKNIQIEENQNLEEQQALYVHNEIINNADYTYENEVSVKDNQYLVRNVYGAFVTREIVCEGYARALKMVLDRLNIPCILVIGVYKHTEEALEPHMWTYVQLEDDNWYAIDATFDDPSTGTENLEYFLVGDDKIGAKHIPTGIVSESEYMFTYPTLKTTTDKFDTVYNTDGLVVELDDQSFDERDDITAAAFKISYKNMGYKKAAQAGYYIIGNFHQYYPGNDAWTESGWAYFRTDIGDGGLYSNAFLESEDGTYFSFYMTHCKYIEIAVTDIAPAEYEKGKNYTVEDIVRQTTYLGTPSSMIVMTDKIYNPNGDYVAPPYVKKATPIVNSAMMIGSTYHCTVEYDDKLIQTGEIGINVVIEDPFLGRKQVDNKDYKLENFQFDGDKTFTFDFTPSEMFSEDSVFYHIEFTGVVGEKSRKAPNTLNYYCQHACAMYAYRAQGIDMNIFGKPKLMGNDINLDVEGWTDQENDELSELLKHRITLVTSTTTKTEKDNMNEFLNNATQNPNGESLDKGQGIIETETYNINLTLCKQQSKQLTNGTSLRIMVGFPAGYGPEDEGVTFKAYHYIKDNTGKITGVEEIPCVVTKLGLVITCTSFSPFTIAAVKEDEEASKNETKTIVISNSEGGTVTTQENSTIIEIKPNETKTISIKAQDNYEIDEIVIGEELKAVTDEKEMTIDISYDSLKEDTTITKIGFAAKSVREQEREEELEVVAQPIAIEPTFTTTISTSLGTTESVRAGDTFEVTVSTESFTDMPEQMITISGKLEYENSKVTLQKIEGVGEWTISEQGYNNNTYEFVAKRNQTTIENGHPKNTPEAVVKATYKVNENLVNSSTVSIKLTSVKGGMGLQENGTAVAKDIQTTITISGIPDTITSQEYNIKDGYIKKVEPGTTLAEFKQKINAQKAYTITKTVSSDEGNKQEELTDNSIIGTGTQLTIGAKTYIIVVSGDIDGNGALGPNDVVAIELYIIHKQDLQGAKLEAAILDADTEVGVNDLAVLLKRTINISE